MPIENLLWTTWIVLLAFVVFSLRLNRLRGWEWMVFLIIALNCAADLLVPYTRKSFETEYSGIIYNSLAIAQRLLTLMIYAFNTRVKEERFLNYAGIVVLILASIGAHFYYQDYTSFYRVPYVILGLIVAICSYIHLRNMILEKTGVSMVIGAFSLANFVYLTLMISSVSAVGLAYNMDKDFGRLIYFLGNGVGYMLWSVILIIGILWKK
ncbi:MAG: hypothetical protein WBG42_04460 [Cryomorphaceae bacterium]